MAPSRIGRALFGGVLAYASIENFRDMDGRIEYARAKDVPVPEFLVPAASALLLLSSLGIALWRSPRAAAAGIVVWFLGTTPAMHDFWSEEGEARASERSAFVKNTALLGAALTVLSQAGSESEADEA